MERVRARRDVCRVLMGKSEGRDHLEDLSVDGRVVPKRVLKK